MSLDDKELRLDWIDEMNLVELPFSLLTRNTEGIYEIPLSADGKTRVVCANSTKYGLPNNLADLVLLGLMKMWKSEGGRNRSFEVKIRELVVRYIDPDNPHAPGGDFLRSVERQIHCIANARIHTDRWWDKKLRQHTEADIAIISDVVLLDRGGRNRHRVLRITWGDYFWESMIHGYTKAIDSRLIQRLPPLERRLYRLLDRQLNRKTRKTQHLCANIVKFARFKLLMQAKKINQGGRTALNYVIPRLTKAMDHLRREGLPYRMTRSSASDPFRVTFERIDQSKLAQDPEERDPDLVGDLVREFQFHAHSVPRDQQGSRIAEADRIVAKAWVDTYGFPKAVWMIQRCLKIQKESNKPGILLFRGLQLYESAASGDYESYVAAETKRVERQWSAALDRYWSMYREKLVEVFDAKVSADDLDLLSHEVREEIERENPNVRPTSMETLLRFRLRSRKCRRMNALSESEFRAHRSLRALRGALMERHAIDLLEPPS